MRNAYKDIRNKLDFAQATVVIQDNYFRVTLDSPALGKVEELNNLLSLSSKYNDVNKVFSISETVKVTDLACYYFVDSKWANKVADSCYVQAQSETGLYKVEASKLIPKVITYSTLKCYSKVSNSLLNVSDVKSKFLFHSLYSHI